MIQSNPSRRCGEQLTLYRTGYPSKFDRNQVLACALGSGNWRAIDHSLRSGAAQNVKRGEKSVSVT
jgi:hypothetical protein